MTSSTAEHPILRPPMSTHTSKDGHLHSADTTCSTLNANSGRSANSTGLHKSSPPGCALQVPVMKVGVPGEFHEDRWPRTAEDSERLVDPAHTGSGRDPSDTSYRVAKRSSGRSSARRPYPQVPQRDSRVAKGTSIGPSARRPYPQVLQGHPRVAKGASGRSSARTPYPQVPQ